MFGLVEWKKRKGFTVVLLFDKKICGELIEDQKVASGNTRGKGSVHK